MQKFKLASGTAGQFLVVFRGSHALDHFVGERRAFLVLNTFLYLIFFTVLHHSAHKQTVAHNFFGVVATKVLEWTGIELALGRAQKIVCEHSRICGVGHVGVEPGVSVGNSQARVVGNLLKQLLQP